MLNNIARGSALILFATVLATASAPKTHALLKNSHLQAADHAVAGEVEKIDSKTKTMVIKAEDGTEHTIKYTDKTTVHDLQDAAHATDHIAHQGDHVVVRYAGEGEHATATDVEHLGNTSMKTLDGTIQKVDTTSHTIVVKSKDGTLHTYHVADRAMVDTGKKVENFSETSAKKGERVTVHYSQEAGQAVAHLFKHF
ncbi:MAG TPA: hypothetical protein VMX16_07660 [Terriglobia bacterium]|nr:hypothetical protein [Terriglobia bacterium]